MRIAVLKNRLLQMTGRQFDEGSHGASSFREFLGHYHHILRVDGADVELTGQKKTDARLRVRPDLWQAMMDFSSGRKYAWDHELGRARPAQDSDTLFIPTISSEEMDTWRKEFASSHPDDARVQNWSAQGMGTKGLPGYLQGIWTGVVRDHVVDKLDAWLAANELYDVDPRMGPESDADVKGMEGGHALLELVLRCVAVMTPQELAALHLPPSAVLRAVGEKR